MTYSPQPQRLLRGGRIDRGSALHFSFDGKRMQGFRGDTLASALIANGVRVVGRSFKYHRPRGIFSAGSDEPNALVELRSGAQREPNTKATTVELFAGLEAHSQNRWPSLAFDLRAVNGWFAPLLVAGFYYKTFMWPAAFWERVYEPLIRRAAGLGRAATIADPDIYEKYHLFCDVLVIGGGPTGLTAALAAARSGARVLLCDEDFEPGGRLLGETLEINDMPGPEWVAQVAAELRSFPTVRLLTRTTVFGAYDGNTYAAIERCTDHVPNHDARCARLRYLKIVARQAILATGASERSIAFADNDRPGVMAAGAVRSYVNRFAAVPGRRAAIFTNNDSGWSTARDLAAAGVEVAALVDSREIVPRTRPAWRLLSRGHVMRVRGTTRVHGVDVFSSEGLERLEVDVVAVSGGWNPNAAIATHRGARLQWSEEACAFVCSTPPPGMRLAGAANARWTLAECLADGELAARDALVALGLRPRNAEGIRSSAELSGIEPLWRATHSPRGKSFVDLQTDVTVQDIELATREGFDRSEHVKRYTTLGMGTDQGRGSSVIGHAILATLLRRSLHEVGTTSLRPPYTPVAVGALAGRNRGEAFRCTRYPATHQWAIERGAVVADSGLWKRAHRFPRPEESTTEQTLNRELQAIRDGVGICDASTVGRVEVRGDDAFQYLEKIFANPLGSLAIGRMLYGVMLREDGHMLDDAVIARLGDAHFAISTSTARAEAVLQHLEFHAQVVWPQFDVRILDVTDAWAHVCVLGPRSVDLLREIVDSDSRSVLDRLNPLAVESVTVGGGCAARLYRTSAEGQDSHELAVPARYGDALGRRLMHVGEHLSVTAFGTGALNVRRIEKGQLSSSEVTGHATARDLGLSALLSTSKDYVGRTLAAREGLLDPCRHALVGVRPLAPDAPLYVGSHLLSNEGATRFPRSEGHVTSTAYSPIARSRIGLALLERGGERTGEILHARDPLRKADLRVEVCNPVFADADGSRVRL